MPNHCFPSVTIDEMISHDDLLERYPWLSAQNVNKWRRAGIIRFFNGKRGMLVYPMGDIERALTDSLDASIENYSGAQSSPVDLPAQASTSHHEMSEADQIRERLWLRQIHERKFPRDKTHTRPSNK
ncbi:hypothetical protein J2768_002468 [Agrobacterium tumefaciens]|uniref:hypothetical protein n=1 Tax=Agrobacterium tumefaciens TaxID=358 RepID=UPI001AE3BA49|nr:hypothetical protein [Agrobacterium tumefaciens]MBP2540031.1 hypothetical protein [Agrobacterium tumefaciens]